MGGSTFNHCSGTFTSNSQLWRTPFAEVWSLDLDSGRNGLMAPLSFGSSGAHYGPWRKGTSAKGSTRVALQSSVHPLLNDLQEQRGLRPPQVPPLRFSSTEQASVLASDERKDQ